jgi:aminoglycoside phosphotransferase (APT) family kinase protein
MPQDPLVAVLGRLESELGSLTGEPVALGGGLTNHNVRMCLGGVDVVVRFCAEGVEMLGIDRSVEDLATRRAAALGIAPQVVAYLPDVHVLVTRWVEGGEVPRDQLHEPGTLARIAHALRSFHAGDDLGKAFDVVALARRQVAAARDPDARLARAIDLGVRIGAALTGAEHVPVPCHNDLLGANFVGTGDGLRIVDWEYAGMNDRYFDLANFSVNNELSEDDDRVLLDAYFGAADDRRFAALRLMRVVSDLREAAWGAVQDGRSHLDFDYAGYSREHADRLERSAADPRLPDWLDVAAAA